MNHVLGYEDKTKLLVYLLKFAGVQPDQQMELFRILSAVLHLGNVNIQASGRSADRSYIDVRHLLQLCVTSPLECFSAPINTFLSTVVLCPLSVPML